MDGAGNEIRTRDTKLGKLVLYQLSYARSSKIDIYDKARVLSTYFTSNLGDFLPLKPHAMHAQPLQGSKH